VSGPLVSVIIPFYNRASTLRRAATSVLAQSYASLELILVDDGSTDDGVAVGRAIADPRVRVISNARAKGAQGARNTGILAARGEWIAFNDSDDEWLPGKLERQMRAIEAHRLTPQLVVHGDALLRKAVRTRPMRLPRTDGPDALRRLLLRPSPMLQALLARRRHFEAIGLLDESLPSYQEWDTAIRLAQGSSLVHLREPLFVYSTGHSGAISADGARAARGYACVLAKHVQAIRAVHGIGGLRRHYQWLARRPAVQADAALAREIGGQALLDGDMSGLRRRLFEHSSDPGLAGALAHRLAQAHDRALMLVRAAA